MLDLDNPKTEYIFKAAVLEDQIRDVLSQMQDRGPEQQDELKADITDRILPELRQLNQDHFDSCPEIAAALEKLAVTVKNEDLDACWAEFSHFSDSMGDNFGSCFI
ncbi:hypothetical protein [Budvicia diplopodorum]|uniref:hypothetical protein n=1 Tax=Budvicia diplopodorum TaxID=1119056 RepID=UPI00135A23EF|nr:hypothetical protein [Budvicia diplopodorum]